MAVSANQKSILRPTVFLEFLDHSHSRLKHCLVLALPILQGVGGGLGIEPEHIKAGLALIAVHADLGAGQTAV